MDMIPPFEQVVSANEYQWALGAVNEHPPWLVISELLSSISGVERQLSEPPLSPGQLLEGLDVLVGAASRAIAVRHSDSYCSIQAVQAPQPSTR